VALRFLQKNKGRYVGKKDAFKHENSGQGEVMSKEICSAVKGSLVGLSIGLAFGIATLATIGFDRMTLFEGALLASCSVFGGVLFGALIGSTGAFRRENEETQTEIRNAFGSPRVA